MFESIDLLSKACVVNARETRGDCGECQRMLTLSAGAHAGMYVCMYIFIRQTWIFTKKLYSDNENNYIFG